MTNAIILAKAGVHLWLRFEPPELQDFHCLPYSHFSAEVLPSRDTRLFVFLLLEGFLEYA